MGRGKNKIVHFAEIVMTRVWFGEYILKKTEHCTIIYIMEVAQCAKFISEESFYDNRTYSYDGECYFICDTFDLRFTEMDT